MNRGWVACTLFVVACGSAVAESPGDVLPDEEGPPVEDSGDREDAASTHSGPDAGSTLDASAVQDARSDSNAAKDSGHDTIQSVDSAMPKDSASADSSFFDAGKDVSTSSTKPAELTVTGSLLGATASHLASSDQKSIVSAFNVSTNATFSPQPGWELPDVWNAASVTIDSPSTGGCDTKPSFTLNKQKVGIMLVGKDVLPALACVNFTDDVAKKGITVTLANVPYPNGGSAKVVIKLTP